MNTVKFIVEKTNTGYSAFVDDLPVYTTGTHMAELKANMLEAFNLYQAETGGRLISPNELSIKFDLPQFFEYYKPVINGKGLAKRVGINEKLLNQYVNGVKVPSEKQTQKILDGIKGLGKELLDFA